MLLMNARNSFRLTRRSRSSICIGNEREEKLESSKAATINHNTIYHRIDPHDRLHENDAIDRQTNETLRQIDISRDEM